MAETCVREPSMIAKRAFDILLAGTGLVLLAPAMAVIAVAIRLESPGPSLYHQERVGRNGKSFAMLKFRTMAPDADTPNPGLARLDDRRILRVGRFLRASKLNELPQLINVLRGDMSIVGPRPEMPMFVAKYSERDRRAILAVRPGITDPASLRYRNEAELLATESDPHAVYIGRIMPRKLAISRRYARRQSLISDAMIVVLTVLAILRPRSVPQARGRGLRNGHRAPHVPAIPS
jgi:lipopolysaccharide/colanic/teichoic acid biosynthesis glycosyltransferase